MINQITMAQQTAVEWLQERYNQGDGYDRHLTEEEFEQAKQMEKQQISDASDISNKNYEYSIRIKGNAEELPTTTELYYVEQINMTQQKLYTEEQVKKVWKAGMKYWETSGASITLEELLEQEKPIQPPSDEEIVDMSQEEPDDSGLSPSEEFQRGAKFVINKILQHGME